MAAVPASSADAAAPAPASTRTLIVYFSRAGENYYNGGRRNLTTGNTEVVARMMQAALGCELHPLLAADPYSDRYDDTVARNVREQDAGARPALVGPIPSLDPYDRILIGSPIWNVRPPRIMLTFAEALDFTGKRVFPFVTYAVSGLGRAVEEYTSACRGATFGEALAIRGEEAESSRSAVEAWLRRTGLSV